MGKIAYTPGAIEPKWREYWEKEKVYAARETADRPKYYVLDMFPYPSGAGLHVGHPLGYIASDIVARYRRHLGYEVLHPMGFDAFGLPAEQYAIETGQHPAETTYRNIEVYRRQLRQLGLSFDWDREVVTCDPKYYKWTQWIFLQFFKSWYHQAADRAEPIDTLIQHFEEKGTEGLRAAASEPLSFTADEWKAMDEKTRQQVLLNYRLAYLDEAEVNWCPALGTVLANEEVKDGLSERGGHPVYRVKMKQWFLRITAYAERLLRDLERVDWPESTKEMQRHWIGRSEGAEVRFPIAVPAMEASLDIFTTRPDTLFGVTFMVLAPEHPLTEQITDEEHMAAVKEYIEATRRKTARDRQINETMTGVFTGAYARHPLTDELIPIWVSDYVLMDYGTGAIMAVPAHDSRDYRFARRFGLPIRPVIEGGELSTASFDSKEARVINSGPITGLPVPEAIERIIQILEEKGIGKRQVQYRLRDVGFSRQRYWGEPFPIVYRDGIPYPVPEEALPVELPPTDSFEPSPDGQPPLARLTEWVNLPDGSRRETNTMPAWAGSSWYFLRYMDPHNDERFVSPEKEQYWKNVDFYLGGPEHATGHLLYARFWHKFLHDRGWVSTVEPFQKLVHQGMILGKSALIHRIKDTQTFVSADKAANYDTVRLHINIHLVEGQDVVNLEQLRKWRKDFAEAEYILSDDGRFYCERELDKMSKSRHNVVNPDDIIAQYGCDTFRMYEMFLGPIRQSKPWDTQNIGGVHRFLRRLYALYFDAEGRFAWDTTAPTAEEWKAWHTALRQVRHDIEHYSFNTAISAMMVLVNFLHKSGCRKQAILEPLIIMISPFAPHLAEELWHLAGHTDSVTRQPYPEVDETYLVEDTFTYPISVNGKVRARVELPKEVSEEQVRTEVLSHPQVKKWVDGKQVRRIIIVPGRIINIVVG